ncbi:putative methyltransferase [Bryobacterales bacterium F-183]|nr:putative methyltransferase [Bryobacterales bacterium F-183]
MHWYDGHDQHAEAFRQRRSTTIGVVEVQRWAAQLPPKAKVADLGCGFGYPLTAALVNAGCSVYGVDRSPKLLKMLEASLPQVRTECADVLSATCNGEKDFDACLAWGLFFLLSESDQRQLIAKVATILRPQGELLFTSPRQPLRWPDALTGVPSVSLGEDEYRKVLQENGFDLFEQFQDEGENHYYHCRLHYHLCVSSV